MPSLKFESNECLGANLQMMFTLMKESVRKSIDPNFFIRAIGLDENMQQVFLLNSICFSNLLRISNIACNIVLFFLKTRMLKSLVSYFSRRFRAVWVPTMKSPKRMISLKSYSKENTHILPSMYFFIFTRKNSINFGE